MKTTRRKLNSVIQRFLLEQEGLSDRNPYSEFREDELNAKEKLIYASEEYNNFFSSIIFFHI